MKILVVSDSHGNLTFIRECIQFVKPDCMIHLGDHYADGSRIQTEYPHMQIYQVPGNCDKLGWELSAEQPFTCRIGQLLFFITHGHHYHVKSGLDKLLLYGKLLSADVVLFGHTHQALCLQDQNGMLVMNPGTCGYPAYTAGVIEIVQGKITDSKIITKNDLGV